MHLNRNDRKRTCRHMPPMKVHSRSLIRIFTGSILASQGCTVSSCGQRRLYQTVRMRKLTVSSLAAHVRRYVIHVVARFLVVIPRHTSVCRTSVRPSVRIPDDNLSKYLWTFDKVDNLSKYQWILRQTWYVH